jgi:hypothetical protein
MPGGNRQTQTRNAPLTSNRPVRSRSAACAGVCCRVKGGVPRGERGLVLAAPPHRQSRSTLGLVQFLRGRRYISEEAEPFALVVRFMVRPGSEEAFDRLMQETA